MKPEIYLIPNWTGVAAGTVVRKKQLTGGAESVLSITIARFMTPLAMGRMANAISITRHGSVTLRVRRGVASSCRRRSSPSVAVSPLIGSVTCGELHCNRKMA